VLPASADLDIVVRNALHALEFRSDSDRAGVEAMFHKARELVFAAPAQ
jgi:hypothetical protein